MVALHALEPETFTPGPMLRSIVVLYFLVVSLTRKSGTLMKPRRARAESMLDVFRESLRALQLWTGSKRTGAMLGLEAS